MAEKKYTIGSVKSVRGDPTLVRGLLDDSITELTVDKLEGITKIGDNKFFNSFNLTKLELPESLEYIGENSIVGCGITELTIPKNVRHIDRSSIQNMSSLTKINMESEDFDYIASGVFKYLNSNAYYDEDGLSFISTKNNPYFVLTGEYYSGLPEHFVFPKDTEWFTGQFSFSNIEILDFEENSKLRNFPNGCCEQCSNLRKVVIPENIEFMDPFCNYCYSLEEVDYRSNKVVVGTQNQGAGIGWSTDSLQKVKIHNMDAFCQSRFDNVNYGMLRTASELYDKNDNLITHINISEGVEYIAPYAFYFNINPNTTITEITIPKSIKNIGRMIIDGSIYTGDSFYNIDNISLVNYNAENASINETRLNFSSNNTNAKLIVGSDVTKVPDSFGSNNKCFSEIDIQGLPVIPNYMFNNSNLKKISIGSITNIIHRAFVSCSKLETVDLSNAKFIDISSTAFQDSNTSTISLIVPAKYYTQYSKSLWFDRFTNITISGTAIDGLKDVTVVKPSSYIEYRPSLIGTFSNPTVNITSSNPLVTPIYIGIENSSPFNTLIFRLDPKSTGSEDYNSDITISITDDNGQVTETSFNIKVILNIGNSELISFSDVEGASYNFIEDETGNYTNTNIGLDSSAAMTQINFFANGVDKMYIDFSQSSENGHDYGIIGKIDCELSPAYNANDGENIHTTLINKDGIILVDMGIPELGEHFVQVKYRKDGSTANGSDTLKIIQVRFEEQ